MIPTALGVAGAPPSPYNALKISNEASSAAKGVNTQEMAIQKKPGRRRSRRPHRCARRPQNNSGQADASVNTDITHCWRPEGI